MTVRPARSDAVLAPVGIRIMSQVVLSPLQRSRLERLRDSHRSPRDVTRITISRIVQVDSISCLTVERVRRIDDILPGFFICLQFLI